MGSIHMERGKVKEYFSTQMDLNTRGRGLTMHEMDMERTIM